MLEILKEKVAEEATDMQAYRELAEKMREHGKLAEAHILDCIADDEETHHHWLQKIMGE